MALDLSEENMQRLDKKITVIGMPEELKTVMRERASNADEGYFFLDHKTVIDDQNVEVTLGFQNRGTRQDWFEPDLLGVTLQRNPANIVDRNVFFLPSGEDVNIREAYNLMQGRAIMRHAGIFGEDTYWMRLNIQNEFHGIRGPEIVKGHKDVEDLIRQSPMAKKVSSEEKTAIVRGLEQGDRHRLDRADGASFFLIANPEKDRIDLENEKRQLLNWKLFSQAIHESHARPGR